MYLLPEPIFVVPTDGVSIITINSSNNGRLFLGGRDGSLFEIEYKVVQIFNSSNNVLTKIIHCSKFIRRFFFKG